MNNFILWIGSDHPRANWDKDATQKIADYLYGWGLLHPTWSHIYEALISMDGLTLNEVVLIERDRGALMAGGGDRKTYIVVYFPKSTPERGSLTLIEPSVKDDQETIVLTVQTPSQYPARFGVQQALVLKVFKDFFDTRDIPKDALWENE